MGGGAGSRLVRLRGAAKAANYCRAPAAWGEAAVVTAITCPYCTASLAKEPQRKTKCKACGQFIFVRRLPPDWVPHVFTEEGAAEVDRQREAEYLSTLPTAEQRAAQERQRLLDWKANPHWRPERVQIIACVEARACATCTAQHERILTLDEALATNPLPHSGCTNQPCRCMYIAVVLPR